MQTSRDLAPNDAESDGLNVRTPVIVMGLSTVYAAALGYLERRYPIKPDHTWAEVAGGVVISLLPVALTARNAPQMHWRRYESAVWRCFIASGTPIILWQLGEAIVRQIELLRYTAKRDLNTLESYADHTTPLAIRSGTGARRGDQGC